MINKNTKIQTVLFCLFIVLITKPQMVTRFFIADLVWDVTVLALFIVALVVMVAQKKYKKADVFLGLFCLFYCGCTFFMASENTLGAISSCIRIWLGYSCVRMLLTENKTYTVHCIAVAFSIELYFEFFIFILSYFFNLFGDVRFTMLGYDNYAIFAIIPMLAVIFYDSFFRYRYFSVNPLLLFVLMFSEKLVTNAVTSIVVLVLFAIAIYCVRYKTRFQNCFNHKTGLTILLVLSVLIIVFHAQDLFVGIFELLGKDVTLSGRTTIWDGSLRAISDSIVFGHGRTTPGEFLQLAGLPLYESSWGHTHNGILELMYTVGLIGIALYFAFLAAVFSKKGSKPALAQAKKILLAGVFAYAILMFTDSYFFLVPFYILLAVYNAPLEQAGSRDRETREVKE